MANHSISQDDIVPPGSQASTGMLPVASDNMLVVGIGASAGGLEACRRFVRALPGETGMAFVLIQHLDPSHESMMADLLAGNTDLLVCQATEGMAIEREHFYIIPPGAYLSIAGGALHLSQPLARHGARLPFDFFLHSLADSCATSAIAVILSGTGADGSLGLQSVSRRGGYVIAQDPEEASYDGMPRNAIRTGAVDLVAPLDAMPAALRERARLLSSMPPGLSVLADDRAHIGQQAIVDLLRTRTGHDFTLYKQGTLERRIERRMALAGIEPQAKARYLERLATDPAEVDLLAQDLLINVTSFFRDPAVFDLLASDTIPALVAAQLPDEPIRIWTAGCSTGEETYSLVILFREFMERTGRSLKLQFFASDVDGEAIAAAREGLYPASITGDVSPARLAKFFVKEGRGYRVRPELRAAVVFTAQDILTAPPFSRLDFVSCRNLLIYLMPAAQAQVFALFHFALRKGGVLLLGNAEAAADHDERFAVISKSARLYQHVASQRPGEHRFSINPRDTSRGIARASTPEIRSRQTVLADLCRRLVLEGHAPASVLINHRHECLFSLGATDRFLHVAPGHPSHDLIAMAPPAVRARLRGAIQRAIHDGSPVGVPGCETTYGGMTLGFRIAVQPVTSDTEDLVLVCFVEERLSERLPVRSRLPPGSVSGDELEHELEVTRAELQAAIHALDVSGDDQKAINDEASSLNEELVSTNEELQTSKEELQSLNEELTALNAQLQEALERQRTMSNDLQNVLNSTNVATIFLDASLHIRFFTPATRALFNVIPGDIGRPLADLKSLSADGALLSDARTVLQTREPIEREIAAQSGLWYIRRVLPYRTEDAAVEGVVITFVDSTERRHASEALGAAKREADVASVAKSRFLAAASHDLRQPLQSLSLMGGVLAKAIRTGRAEDALVMVARLDETTAAMSAMLTALLDITQIDGGSVAPEIQRFAIGDLFERMRSEFIDQADAQGIALRIVPSSLKIQSDRHLIGQMLRNLLSNALKYTAHGTVLLGCRRRKSSVLIEVWDTGIGIPAGELDAIFDEYHQVDNGTRARNRGLGLGLSIVQRLAGVLGHRVRVRSELGRGSMFCIEIKLPASQIETALDPDESGPDLGAGPADTTGEILVVEDDPEVRELLNLLLRDEGHHVTTAINGAAALALFAGGGMIRPDLLLADLNLPDGLNGLQLAARLRDELHRDIPVIILTGDLSPETQREAARQNCVQLTKPVKVKELIHTIQLLLPRTRAATPLPTPVPAGPKTVASPASPSPPVVIIIDDDPQVGEAIRALFEDTGHVVEVYSSAEAFLKTYRPGRPACLLIDAYLPGMSGLDLLRTLQDGGRPPTMIMITGRSDVQMVVQAMKAGAVDFIEKPIGRHDLLAAVDQAIAHALDANKLVAWQEEAAGHIASLTPRQREIMDMVLAGHPSKNIAADLDISQRTVENHRAEIMRRTGVKSLPALARLALAARPAADERQSR